MLKTIKKIGHLIYKDVRGSQRMRLRDSYDDLKLLQIGFFALAFALFGIFKDFSTK